MPQLIDFGVRKSHVKSGKYNRNFQCKRQKEGYLTAANVVILRTDAHNSINMYAIYNAYNVIVYFWMAKFA